MNKPWIRLISGRAFPLENPQLSDFRLEDIAHNLSRINRYTGAIAPEHYSVAEHSIRVAFYTRALLKRVMPRASKDSLTHAFRAGLMHDAAEAYLNDLSSPLKRLDELEGYQQVSDRYDALLSTRFSLRTFHGAGVDLVHEADLAIFDAEHPILQPGPGPRAPILAKLPPVENLGAVGYFGNWGWTPNIAKRFFLEYALEDAGFSD